MTPTTRTLARIAVALTALALFAIAAVALVRAGWPLLAPRDSTGAAPAAAPAAVPVFSEVGEGARAPSGGNALLGAVVGVTTRAELDAALARAGVPCVDTSIGAAMARTRADREHGDEPDGVTEASRGSDAQHAQHAKHAVSAQVRLSCEGVAGHAFADRDRGDDVGRALFVFDAPTLPLRHASYAQKVRAPDVALARFNAAVDAFTQRYGEPTSTTGGEPDPSAAEPFPRARVFKRAWRFADLHAEVNALRLGGAGVTVRETVEVPWPVRSDAPALAR